jgi:hypothetical protein
MEITLLNFKAHCLSVLASAKAKGQIVSIVRLKFSRFHAFYEIHVFKIRGGPVSTDVGLSRSRFEPILHKLVHPPLSYP